jgi:hypothetical protein
MVPRPALRDEAKAVGLGIVSGALTHLLLSKARR